MAGFMISSMLPTEPWRGPKRLWAKGLYRRSGCDTLQCGLKHVVFSLRMRKALPGAIGPLPNVPVIPSENLTGTRAGCRWRSRGTRCADSCTPLLCRLCMCFIVYVIGCVLCLSVCLDSCTPYHFVCLFVLFIRCSLCMFVFA